jgi:hypothetical protein
MLVEDVDAQGIEDEKIRLCMDRRIPSLFGLFVMH